MKDYVGHFILVRRPDKDELEILEVITAQDNDTVFIFSKHHHSGWFGISIVQLINNGWIVSPDVPKGYGI